MPIGGKEPHKRAVYTADVAARVVRRVALADPTVASVLEHARSLPRALVAFDAPIGMPSSFLTAIRPNLGFLEWLTTAQLDECAGATTWCLDRPFFRVPPGKGALSAFTARAASHGVSLRRTIETQTRAKSAFILPASRAAWARRRAICCAACSASGAPRGRG